jgi:hypothetical protein
VCVSTYTRNVGPTSCPGKGAASPESTPCPAQAALEEAIEILLTPQPPYWSVRTDERGVLRKQAPRPRQSHRGKGACEGVVASSTWISLCIAMKQDRKTGCGGRKVVCAIGAPTRLFLCKPRRIKLLGSNSMLRNTIWIWRIMASSRRCLVEEDAKNTADSTCCFASSPLRRALESIPDSAEEGGLSHYR